MGQLHSKLGKRDRRSPMLFTVQVTLVATLFVFLGTQILQRMGFSLMNTEPASSTPVFLPPAAAPTADPALGEAASAPVNANSPAKQPEKSDSPSLEGTTPEPENAELAYNTKQPANLTQSEELQAIVDEIVDVAAQRGLPIDPLSISLIDVKSGTTATYQDQTLRFPASITKLFWLVELYAWIEAGRLPREAGQYDLARCQDDLCRLIQDSDNEAASHLVDRLTQTQSGQRLQGEAFELWLDQRKELNRFFQRAGFDGIDVSQKNFPIPDLGLDRPTGADLTMRGDPGNPIRNKISTAQAARLMYDIVSGQAVSAAASQQMIQLLTRYDLPNGAWRNKEYNSIQGFFGEFLPPNTYLASKVGWTSESRQEVAYISTPDGKTAYILVIFADHPAYGEDWKIFPELSRLVFDRMVQ